MKRIKTILIFTAKAFLGIILGLFFSLVIILILERVLPKPNPFQKEAVNLWFIGPIIAVCLLAGMWLVFRKISSKKIQTHGITNLPVSVSALIDAIIDAMRYRRCERAEVRQELTDHFTDALARCKTDQEKLQRIGQLIEEFGDAELLGTLIRRGKKRCQPLWRKTLEHIPHAVGISILLLIAYIGWFFTGKPSVTVDYLAVFNQQARPTVDDGQNAWPYYEQAIQQYVKPDTLDPAAGLISDGYLDAKKEFYLANDVITFDISPRSMKTLSEPGRSIMKQWLADNVQTLEWARQGNQQPYCWRHYTCGDAGSTEMINVLLPHLSELRDIARLLCWQGIKAADEGDFDKGFDSLLGSYLLGQHVRKQSGMLIEQLVGIAIQSVSCETYRVMLNDYAEKIDPRSISRIRQTFENGIANEDFTISFEGEKLFLYDEAQRCFTKSRFGKSHLYLPRLAQHGIGPYEEEGLFLEYGFSILFTHPDKEQTLKTAERLYDEMDTLARQTPAGRRGSDEAFDKLLEEATRDNLLLRTLFPALQKVTELSYRIRVNTQATLVILSLTEYYKQHQDYPDALRALVEGKYIREIPTDPFSDQPLGYRKTDGNFVLYSVGTNFTDDGGLPATDDEGKPRKWGDHGDWIFWPVTDDE